MRFKDIQVVLTELLLCPVPGANAPAFLPEGLRGHDFIAPQGRSYLSHDPTIPAFT